jgi:two-component system nitrate/nitrite response regulator NarL
LTTSYLKISYGLLAFWCLPKTHFHLYICFRTSLLAMSPKKSTIPYRVSIVDDHQLFGETFGIFLKKKFDVEVVGVYRSAAELLKQIKAGEVDIILMDVSMPEMNGIEATRILLKAHPELKVVAVSAADDMYTLEEMFRAGACGFISKSFSAQELERMFTCMRINEKYIPDQLAIEYARYSISHTKQVEEAVSSAEDQYSQREIQVIIGISEGKTDKEIALELGVSSKTVEWEKRKIMNRMGVKKAAHIVTIAFKLGLIH